MKLEKLEIGIGALLFAFVMGCGPSTPPARSAADEDIAPAKPAPAPAPAPKKAAAEPEAAHEAAAEPPPQPMQKAPPVKKVSASDRVDFDAAWKKWEAATEKGPMGKKECEKVADAFADAAKHADVAAQAHFNAGTILDGCGQEEDAIKEYQAALSANPRFGWAINNLGEIAYRHKNYADARAKFEQAIAADPTRVASAYNNLAVMLFQEGRDGNPSAYKDAISKLRRALAIENDSMPAYALLALIYYTTAESDRAKLSLAELVCKQGKEKDEKYAPIYNTLGLIQLRKKNVTGALKEFEKAVGLDPRYVEAHLNIGAIGLSSRQYEKAGQSFEAVLKLQPTNVDATIGMGVALRGQKRFDEAERWYKKAGELDPKNCAVPYNLGLLYQDYKTEADNKNLREAQGFYRQYVGCGKTDKRKVDDANRRIKEIDDTFIAIEQAKKMEEEAKKIQEEAEKQMEEMKKQQAAQEAAAAEAAKKEAEKKEQEKKK
jgi:tetratricopeptide (TPR) repeat protein